jgi:hypothetical protein
MLRSLAADHLGTAGFFRFDLPFDEALRRNNMKGRMDFGERELEQWWHDHDALRGCGEQVIGAAQDPDAIVDLITTTMRW